MPGLEWGDEFAGHKVVLTGACGVIGRWIAEAFAEVGARLCLSDQRGDALAALAEKLSVVSDGGIVHATNLSDSQSIDDLVDFIVARILDHLDVTHDLVPRWGEPGRA